MPKLKIGLLGLTLEFYESLGADIRLGREKFVREKLIPALSPAANVRFDRAVFTRADVERAVAGFEAEGCDVLVIVLLTYSPSLISAPILARTHLPLVIWNTQELLAVDSTYGDAELIANHGVHGTHDLCNVLVRAGVRFGYVTGHADDEECLATLADHFAAGAAVGRLRRARLGLLGYPFPGMGDFGLDTTHLALTLGSQWEALSLSEFVRRAAGADAGAVAKIAAEYRASYDVSGDVTVDDLAAAARAEVALRGLIADYKLDAYSYQFLAFGQDERVETLPFVAASRLLAEGVGFGGEGDLISAAHSALVNWLAPPATFSEIFTIDFAGNAVLVSHMGECNVAMARQGRVRLVKRGKSLVPIRGSQLALVCAFEPGPATLTALTLSADQRWRILATTLLIEDFGPLKQLAVPHSKLRPWGEVKDFLNSYANAGGPHHLALCFGDACDRLALAAKYLGAEYVEV